MTVKEYYALRNKDNVYGEMEGIEEAYETRIREMNFKQQSMCFNILDLKAQLKSLETDYKYITERLELLKYKLKIVKDQGYINRLLLDYDEVVIFQNSDYYHLLTL